MKYDLHTHTTESDGEYTPTEIVEFARDSGLELIAKTDHNSIEGNKQAVKAGEKYGIKVIPGVEISTRSGDVRAHILGYNIYEVNPELTKFFDKCAKSRDNATEKRCRLAQKNPIILSDGSVIKPTIEEIGQISKNDQKGDMHVGVYIANKINELYNKINGTENEMIIDGYGAVGLFLVGKQKEINQYKKILAPLLKEGQIGKTFWAAKADKNLIGLISIENAIKNIINSGGVPVLAHPGYNGIEKEYIAYLKDIGLQGIEVFTLKHNEEQVKKYLKIAEELELFVSGGSDFHGMTYSVVEELGHWNKRQEKDKKQLPYQEVKPLIELLIN